MSQRPRSHPFFDVRMRGFRDRAEVEDVRTMVAQRVQPLEAETCPLTEAAGRVLAQDIIAGVDVPGFDRAAMDGYALRGHETFGAGPYLPLQFTIVGESWPGKLYPGILATGQAVRIMTGAPVPSGADAVLQAEAAEESSGKLRVTEAVPPGRNIGRKGEDIAVGTQVLSQGRRLRPQDLGVLASLGIATLRVLRMPTVAIFITGNELLPPGSRPEGYRIVDSNSIMLRALVERDGGRPSPTRVLSDQRDAIVAALASAAEEVVLITGGSSVGQEDFAPGVLAELGELAVHGMALRPASPTGVGFINGRPVFLLPGNPVSCLCAYDFFAGPAIRRLGGRSMEWPYRCERLPLAAKLVSVAGRVDYVRVRIRNGLVEPMATSGASQLSSTTRADGFVVTPRDSEGYAAGEVVSVYRYDEVCSCP